MYKHARIDDDSDLIALLFRKNNLGAKITSETFSK